MARVFIHIGIGKTGTSAIQSLLAKNDSLLISLGLYYPKIGLIDLAHHGLAPLGEKVPTLATRTLYLELLNEMSSMNGKSIVISSEHFCFMQESFVEAVAEFFHGHDVKIIFYVREQAGLIKSSYLQKVKMGYSRQDTLGEFFDAHAESFDFNKRISAWSKYFGNSNIIVRGYMLGAERIDSRVDFLTSIGLTRERISHIISHFPGEKLINKSFSFELCRLVNMIDQIGPAKDKRKEIMSEIERISGLLDSSKYANGFDECLANKITSYYAASNKKFALDYNFPDILRDRQ